MRKMIVATRSRSNFGTGIPRRRQEALSLRPGQEPTGGPDQLERIPLDGVVAGRQHEPPRGVVVLYGQLAARRRREPDVDDVAADELQRADDDAVKHRSRDAAIPTDHDRP